MQQHDLEFNFKARYYTLGKITEATKQIWFVLHGYGQLARYFIRKFNILLDQDIFVIAPEGLSKFYIDNLQSTGRASDRVGATWMTKENRLVDIENYLHFLNALYDQQIGSQSEIPLTVLGFSQGAATASRWVTDNKISFSRLILWSGIFPPDVNFESGRETLRNKQVLLVYGKSDPFINKSHLTEMEMIADKLDITPQRFSFDGKHEIEEKTLLAIV